MQSTPKSDHLREVLQYPLSGKILCESPLWYEGSVVCETNLTKFYLFITITINQHFSFALTW